MQRISRYLLLITLLFTGVDLSAQRAAVTPDGKGAVASVNEVATKIGLETYARGGNALDAAIAVAYTLGVVDSHNSGIGGGCFILARLATGEVIAIDGREMAPAAARRDLFIVDGKYIRNLSKTGALASGIPGSVMALERLHGKGGVLKLNSLILPAAEIAGKGFSIDNVLATRLNYTQSRLNAFSESKRIFSKADGSEWRPGDILVQKDLSKTYKALARKGSKYFYQGKIAGAVEKWMQKNGGIITKEDFKSYQVKYRTPVKTSFMGYEVYGFPSPSSGGIAVAQILQMIEQSGYDYKKLSEVDQYHLVIEVMRLAFADRAHWLGDADFVPVPKNLISEDYAKSRVKGLSLKKMAADVSHGTPKNAEQEIFNKHTTHLTTADAEGNWVAITTTLNTSFGSKVTIPGTGVLMNNQMDDFSAQPGTPNAFGLVGTEANAVASRKRPLSSMSPTLVMSKGKPVLTVGAAGGPTIISQVAQAILNHLALKLSLEESVSKARLHHQWKPERVWVDAYMSESVKKELGRRGFNIANWPGFGATQAISLENGKFVPVSEPRLDSR